MADKPRYTDLENKIKKLECLALDCKRKEKNFREAKTDRNPSLETDDEPGEDS